MTDFNLLRDENCMEMARWQGIPETGEAVQEIIEMEKAFIGEPDVEAYHEVAACALTCKTCKALTCKETGLD